jgi:ankyrin repeat protein
LDINLRDKANNTPLHFASKYGNIDICRYLVGLNCLTGSRNSSNQSPYDVAESHIVRQYLLPLQFQEEAKHPDAIAQQQLPQDPFALGGRSSVPTNVAPPPVFSPPSGGGGYSSQQAGGYPMHNRYVAYPGMEDNSGPQQQSSPAPQQYINQSQPISNTQSPAMQRYQPPAANKSVSHMIQPGENSSLSRL